MSVIASATPVEPAPELADDAPAVPFAPALQFVPEPALPVGPASFSSPQAPSVPPAASSIPSVPACSLPPVPKFQRNWAKGGRLAFLTSHLESYKSAAAQGRSRGNDYLDTVVNQYFGRFSWRLPLNSEPNDVDPQDLTDDPTTPEEVVRKKAIIVAMRKSITTWMTYRASKNLLAQSQDVAKNPFALLLGNLSGVPNRPLKKLTAEQRWSKEFYETRIKADFEQHWAKVGLSEKHRAAERARFTAACFARESAEVREYWATRAQADHDTAMKEWEASQQASPPMDPQSRQDAIDRIGSFISPILEGVGKILGMHVCVLLGGPEPRQQGNISVLSMHYGANREPIPRNWQEVDKKKFKVVTNLFKEYLNTCYTEEECQLSRLPEVPDAQYTIQDNDDVDPLTGETRDENGHGVKPSRVESSQRNRLRRKKSRKGTHPSDSEKETDSSSASNSSSDEESRAGDGPSRKRRRVDPPPFSAQRVEYVPIGSGRFKAVPTAKKPSKTVSRRTRDTPQEARSGIDESTPPVTSDPAEATASTTAAAPCKDSHGVNHNVDNNTSHSAGTSAAVDSDTRGDAPAVAQEAVANGAAPVVRVVSETENGNAPVVPAISDNAPPSNEQQMDGRTASTTRIATVEGHKVASPGVNANRETLGRSSSDDSGREGHDLRIELPSECPRWIQNAVATLQTVDLGPEWTRLVIKYVENEHRSQFIDRKGGMHALSSTNRPPQVSWWINRARIGTPDIEDARQFGVKWWGWWCSLQPSWRATSPPARNQTYVPNRQMGTDWHVLCKPGQNGLLSIMVSLMWWGLADEGQGWQHSSWRAALEDVHWVLDALLADHE